MLVDMKGLLRLVAALCAIALIAACTPRRSVVVQRTGVAYSSPQAHGTPPPAPGGTYQVVKGDTLHSIAFRHGVDFRSLAGWNQIAAPYTIWPGQQLRLGPGRASTVAAAPHPARTPQSTSTAVARQGSGSLPAKPAPVTSSHGAPTPTKPMFEPVGSSTTGAAAALSSVPSATPPETTVPVAGESTSAQPAPPPPAPPSAAPAAAGGTRTADGVTWRWPADGKVFKKFQTGDAIPGVEIAGRSGDPVRAAADGVVVYSGNGLVGYGELVIIKHNDSFLSAYGHNSKRLVKEGQRVTAGQEIAEMGSTGAPRDELQFQIRKNGNPVDPMRYLPGR